MQWHGRISLLNLGYFAQASAVIGLFNGHYLVSLMAVGWAIFFLVTEWLERMSKESTATKKRFAYLLLANMLVSTIFVFSVFLCVVGHVILFGFWLDFLMGLKRGNATV